jgi:hypothetical protein
VQQEIESNFEVAFSGERLNNTNDQNQSQTKS